MSFLHAGHTYYVIIAVEYFGAATKALVFSSTHVYTQYIRYMYLKYFPEVWTSIHTYIDTQTRPMHSREAYVRISYVEKLTVLAGNTICNVDYETPEANGRPVESFCR